MDTASEIVVGGSVKGIHRYAYAVGNIAKDAHLMISRHSAFLHLAPTNGPEALTAADGGEAAVPARDLPDHAKPGDDRRDDCSAILEAEISKGRSSTPRP